MIVSTGPPTGPPPSSEKIGTKMTDTNNLEISPTIPPRAGLLRGARLWPDPEGILSSPFIEDGKQLGYIYVYGEESPAVFDGTKWHSILKEGVSIEQEDIAAQYYKIIDEAKTNPNYEDLAGYITGMEQSE